MLYKHITLLFKNKNIILKYYINILYVVLYVEIMFLFLLGHTHRDGIARSYGHCMFNCLRNCQNFQNGFNLNFTYV